MKYIYAAFLSIFILAFSAIDVFAEEYVVDPSLYPPGTFTDEPYFISSDYEGVIDIFEVPQLLATSSGDIDLSFEVQESVSVTQMSYLFRNSSGNTVAQGNWVFNTAYGYNAYSCTFTLYNDGELLFNNPGTLNLCVALTSDNGSGAVNVYRSNGTSEVYNLESGVWPDYEYVYNYLSVDNSLADIVEVTFSATTSQANSPYPPYLGMSILKYGYILIEEEEGPSGPVVVPGDLSGVISYLMAFSFSIIESLFYLEIVSGVTFGNFIIVCIIFGIIAGFFFSNITR